MGSLNDCVSPQPNRYESEDGLQRELSRETIAAKRIAQVPSELDRLQYLVDDQSTLLETLYARLMPILSDNKNKASEDSLSPDTYRVPLADKISTNSNRLSIHNDILRGLIDNLEV